MEDNLAWKSLKEGLIAEGEALTAELALTEDMPPIQRGHKTGRLLLIKEILQWTEKEEARIRMRELDTKKES